MLADRSPLRIINKARQAGISTLIMAEALDAALVRPETLTLFVSRNLDAAVHILSYAYRIVRRLGLSD